jgi:hypothetical protein
MEKKTLHPRLSAFIVIPSQRLPAGKKFLQNTQKLFPSGALLIQQLIQMPPAGLNKRMEF